jgi:hypothetical protein
MAWQVCMTDEYGASSILHNTPDLDNAVEFARKAVHEANMDNALTLSEQLRNWEAFFVQFFDKNKASQKVVFAGKDNRGKLCALNATKPKDLMEVENVKQESRFYIGKVPTNERDPQTKKQVYRDLYAEDERGNLVLDFNHRLILGKTFYFIRSVG